MRWVTAVCAVLFLTSASLAADNRSEVLHEKTIVAQSIRAAFLRRSRYVLPSRLQWQRVLPWPPFEHYDLSAVPNIGGRTSPGDQRLTLAAARTDPKGNQLEA